MRYITLLVGVALAVVVLSGLTWDRDTGALEYKEATAQTFKFMPPLRGAPSSRIGGGTRGPAFSPPLRGAPSSRIGGGTRGEACSPATNILQQANDITVTVQVLTLFDRIGLTIQEQPELYWYLSHDTDCQIEVNLIDAEEGTQPLFEVRFTGLKAGIHRIRLADYDKVRLVPGKRYRWSVALILEEQSRSQDIVASGEIQRLSAAELQKQLTDRQQPDLQEQLTKAAQKDKPRIYAEAGIWYDALATLSALIEASPQDRALRQQRISLLKDEAVNLPEVAAYDEQQQEKMNKSS